MSKILSTSLVLALDDSSADLERVGGKGASLAKMAAAGLAVPPGFHVTTGAYDRFVAEHGLQPQIISALSDVSPDQPAGLETASRQISALFASHAMPEDIALAIREAYAKLGDLPVAVRSSATAEDLPEMSFAGQQETYLNIKGEAAVLDAVKRCWASLWTARAIGYRARHKIAPEDVSLAVVVQELVPAEAAGILFTANPLTGARDQVMINAAWGLGEAIVSGQVTPDTIVVNKADGTIVSQEISQKDVMTVRTPEGTREEPVPEERATSAVLDAKQAAELARIGTRIEQLYSQPMDIEWALHAGTFYVVQARPVTALPDLKESAESQAAKWAKLPNPKGHYMRSSVFELLPDPLSPLFATLGMPSWSRAMKTLLSSMHLQGMLPLEMMAIVNGYGYYDITMSPIQMAKLAAILLYIFPVSYPRLLRSSRQRWQTARENYSGFVDHWQAADLKTASAKDLFDGVRDLTDQAATYYLVVQSGILPSAYLSELYFTQVYNKLVKKPEDPAALAFMLGYDSEPIRAEQSLYNLAQWVRQQPGLAEDLEKVSSEKFTAAYNERAKAWGVWAEFWKRLDAHLAQFGHAIYDLDFAKPVPADDPSATLETLKFFLSGQAQNPTDRQEAATQKREQATQSILSRLRGWRLKTVGGALKWAQGLAPLREDALSDVGLGWPVLRRMLREIGQRLAARGAIAVADDVFWLERRELEEAIAALDDGRDIENYRERVAERHETWKRERAMTPPVALPIKGGTRFMGIDFKGVMPAHSEQSEGDVLKGVAASPGRVAGTARVIHGPTEFGQMQQGDILVARITTPAWTPLFALASGIVTDVGGPLSHSSIVAREYHIPAVLGTGTATERLTSGQRIEVDGDAGTVTIVR